MIHPGMFGLPFEREPTDVDSDFEPSKTSLVNAVFTIRYGQNPEAKADAEQLLKQSGLDIDPWERNVRDDLVPPDRCVDAALRRKRK